jgi:hypothetical protein
MIDIRIKQLYPDNEILLLTEYIRVLAFLLDIAEIGIYKC